MPKPIGSSVRLVNRCPEVTQIIMGSLPLNLPSTQLFGDCNGIYCIVWLTHKKLLCETYADLCSLFSLLTLFSYAFLCCQDWYNILPTSVMYIAMINIMWVTYSLLSFYIQFVGCYTPLIEPISHTTQYNLITHLRTISCYLYNLCYIIAGSVMVTVW